MKTAISINNQLFKKADKLSKKLKMSRSEFYCKAIDKYISEIESSNVTEKLNVIYSNEKSTLDPVLNVIQLSSLDNEEWE